MNIFANGVFVDTSAIYALTNTADRNHDSAAAISRRLVTEQHQLVTTSYVLVETAALLQARHSLQLVRTFQTDLAPLFQVIWIDEHLHTEAVQALFMANRRDLSLVDCSSMVVARQFEIDNIFAFDQHFVEYGFHCLAA